MDLVAQSSSCPQKESFRLIDTPPTHRFLQLLVRFLPLASRLCDHFWPLNTFVDNSAATQHCSHTTLKSCYAPGTPSAHKKTDQCSLFFFRTNGSGASMQGTHYRNALSRSNLHHNVEGGGGEHCGRWSIHFNINLTLSSHVQFLAFSLHISGSLLTEAITHLCNKPLVLLIFKQTPINISFMLLYPNVPSPLQKSHFSSRELFVTSFSQSTSLHCLKKVKNNNTAFLKKTQNWSHL